MNITYVVCNFPEVIPKLSNDCYRITTVQLHKWKSSREECKNYTGKCILRYATSSLQKITVVKIGEKQGGLQKARGYEDQTETVRLLVEKHYAKKGKIICCFYGFREGL